MISCGDIELVLGPFNEFCGERGMKIVHQNIRGIPNKFARLEAL